MRKLLYKPTDSNDLTLKPTITPIPANTAQLRIRTIINKGFKKLNILPVNKIATIITEQAVIKPLTIPANTLPICNAKG